jgi:hypothetical protein
MAAELHVALVHFPVVNRHGEIIGSAITNLDLHDIARAGRTYGITTYWVITPDAQQQELAEQIIGHWTRGYGGRVNPDRADALALTRICSNLDEVIEAIRENSDTEPLLVATSAAENNQQAISCSRLKKKLTGTRPVLLLFGTAWGLAPEILERVDATLPPISGGGEFNHLSVRSAVSIILDRLRGVREGYDEYKI